MGKTSQVNKKGSQFQGPIFNVKVLGSYLAGIFVWIISVSVIYGWYTQNTALIQVNPEFAPMQYNAALGFFLSSVGFLLVAFNKLSWAKIFGGLVTLLGGLTLSQYVFGYNLGIDTFFMEPYVMTKVSHPGRMAPNTALCFIFFGAALVARTRNRMGLTFVYSAQFFGLLVVALSGLALAGYLVNVEVGYGWVGLTRMAIHTATSFFLLGLGFLAYLWRHGLDQVAKVPMWIPILLILAVLTFDLLNPSGLVAGPAYVPLVFVSLWFNDKYAPIVFGTVATLLSVFGYFVAEHIQANEGSLLLTRGLSIIAIWITAFVIFLQKKTWTQYIESQRERERQTRVLEAIQDNMLAGVVLIDTNGTMLSVNRATENIFGYKQKELVGQKVNLLMNPKDKKAHDSYISNYLKTGKGKIIGGAIREVIGRHKNGAPINLDLGVNVAELGGKTIFVGMVADITAQKQALKHTLNEIEKFAYVASHDLRAPLRAIDNLSQWIEEDLGGKLKGETKENMALLRSRVRRLEKLLDDILNYSRAGRVEGELQEIDTESLCREMVGLLPIPKGFKIVVDKSLPTVEAPSGVFEQIFTNLLNNALKHHDQKKGVITVSAEKKEFLYEFTVADDGPGIPDEYRERVFGMFEKLQGRDKAEGSGMGLAIVKKLVESRGGRVGVYGGQGERGTVLKFTWLIDQSRANIFKYRGEGL